MSSSFPILSTCGCCGFTGPAGACGCEAPASTGARPGLPAIPYRVGTHASFLAAMERAMDRQPALASFTVRDTSDPVIGLLDAWATVLDVVTFYQERIANEGYLRTATELKSVYQLADQIGYVPRSGVATTAYLAFEVESGKGAPAALVIDVGVKVQSVPGPNERPQTFETVEKIVARPEWNRIRPRLIDPSRLPRVRDRILYLSGTSTGLKQGDSLLVVWDEGSPKADLRKVASTAVDADLGVTEVTLDDHLGATAALLPTSPPPPGVYAMRQKASLFGHNTPPWKSMAEKFRLDYAAAVGGGATTKQAEWPGFSISAERPPGPTLLLDAVYPRALRQTLAVLKRPHHHARVFHVSSVDEVAAAAFTIAGEVTRLALDPDPAAHFEHHLRDTLVLLQSEPLAVAWPERDRVRGASIAFDRKVAGLVPKQALAFSASAAKEGSLAAEVVLIHKVDNSDPNYTRVTLSSALRNRYDRRRLSISANVARASHGETKTEALGSGDASKSFQTFTLRQSPLTYVPTTGGGGAETTLGVRVNGVSWREVPTLLGRGAREPVYVTRVADDGKVTIEFGDGDTGARLPTGPENVAAAYRIGTGLAGRVRAGQLSLLQTRPLGVKTVTNPVSATGGAEPEALDQARRNAPLTVLTFDRVVSLTDFENFAVAFAGIAKARAAWLWDGHTRLIHVTVAAAGGGPVDPDTTLKNLTMSIRDASDQRQRFLVQSYDPLTFDLAVRLYKDPAYDWTRVRAAALSAVSAAFSFDSRDFAEPVTESSVMAALQAVPGVLGVRLVALNGAGSTAQANPVLTALPARLDNQAVKPAELLTIRTSGIDVQEQR